MDKLTGLGVHCERKADLCHYDKSEKMIGYDVTYRIGNQQGKIRMDKDPGTQNPLDDKGQ
ncbi:TPA: hypothetical protein PXI76_001740 [Yersinia enterocolitica]|nr:hypothetical protein A6J63_003125 [Yersinia enterocolitica]HDL6509457.1 hypothetical protein [Yersinia enterocolitica]HDL8431962.1 hypothetical protein [Yersinia enterocolitica]HDL8466333.1 hypothetical protein [Yersinia enterocolitica]HDL8487191.1 hypothetical protein [Yersinia enterocolitica]